MDEEMHPMKKFTVSKRCNSAVIQVSRQTYVRIIDAKGNVVFSDKSATGELNPLLSPGEYVVDSDGTVKSITASRKRGQDLD